MGVDPNLWRGVGTYLNSNMDLVIAKIGAYKSPGIGFIPTLQLEEQSGPDTTITPFHFSAESAQQTIENALKIAENEAMHKITDRYPKGTKYQIDRG